MTITPIERLHRAYAVLETLDFARSRSGIRNLGKAVEKRIIDRALYEVTLATALDECDEKIARLCAGLPR
jgi:hypothetical protein